MLHLPNNADASLDVKGRRKRGNIATETFRVNVDYNVALVSRQEGSKHFCFPDANSTSSEYVALACKRGNNRETLKVSTCVPDQIGTLSQVGTKKISKGGRPFWNFLSQIGTITRIFVFRVIIKRGFSPVVGTDLAHLGVFLKNFGKETDLINLCNVNGNVPDLRRHRPTQSE